MTVESWTVERWTEEINDLIGEDKKFPHYSAFARAINRARPTVFCILGAKRHPGSGNLRYSYDTALVVCEACGWETSVIPGELTEKEEYKNSMGKRDISNPRMVFGWKLNQRRREINLTIEQLASTAGVSAKTLNNALWGSNCTAKTARLLCKLLGVDPKEIPLAIYDPQKLLAQFARLSRKQATAALSSAKQEELDPEIRYSQANTKDLMRILKIDGPEQLERILRDATINSCYKSLCKEKTGETDYLHSLLAEARRENSVLRTQLLQLQSVSATARPDG